MRSAKPALGVSSTLSDKSERTEAVRYSPDRPILWVGWDIGYSNKSVLKVSQVIPSSPKSFLIYFGCLLKAAF